MSDYLILTLTRDPDLCFQVSNGGLNNFMAGKVFVVNASTAVGP
jgi:hypothetical protein